VLAFEPIGEGDSTGALPGDSTTGLPAPIAFLEALFAEWRPTEGATLYAGRFTAPFGRGHHDFPASCRGCGRMRSRSSRTASASAAA
jgi:hypothetical protein